jgi:hypothetical protein
MTKTYASPTRILLADEVYDVSDALGRELLAPDANGLGPAAVPAPAGAKTVVPGRTAADGQPHGGR